MLGIRNCHEARGNISMRMLEELIKSGYFWLPNTPEKKLPGTLNVSKSGKVILEVIGLFESIPAAFQAPNKAIRINGILENGNAITLDQCSYNNQTIQPISKTKVSALKTYIGACYSETDEPTFTKVTFALEGIDEWLSIKGISVKYNQGDQISIAFNEPQDVSITLPDGLSMQFTFAWTGPSMNCITEAKVTQKANVSLICSTPQPIAFFSELLHKILNFFCFAIDESVHLTSLKGYSDSIVRKIGETKIYPAPISIYYSGLNSDRPAPKIASHDMLFTYSDVSSELQRLMTNWLQNYEISAPAFNLYFAVRADAHAYLDGRFLALAQGIETLHRRNSNGTIMQPMEFLAILKKLIAACPPERRNWLDLRLKYANELPLRERLLQMLAPFEQFFGSENERNSFAAKVVRTRNYLTHHDPSLKAAIDSTSELWSLCQKLEALFQLHFLKLMGLTMDELAILVKNNVPLQMKLKGGWG